jgi:hypothetical protein
MSDNEDPTNQLPEDPISQLKAGLTQMHEVYVSSKEAGFSRSEAMQIVLHMITESMKGP